MNELGDFFKLLAEEKRKKKEEVDSIVGDLGLNSLFQEFAELKKQEKEKKKAKKQKKIEEKKEEETIIGDVNLNSFFEQISDLKKENKKKKIKEEKTIEAFEKWLYSETSKEQEQIIENVIEDSLEEVLEVLEDYKEETREENIIEKSLGLLSEPSDKKMQNDPLTPLDQKFVTIEDLNKHYNLFLSRIQQQLSTLGGGGEYRFRFLDGIVGIKTNSNQYNGKFLQWNSTTNNAEFVNINAVQTDNIVFITGTTNYYQATNNNDYIGVSANVPVIIDLPQSPVVGKKITIKDEGNNISTYNITVRAGIGASVENDTSVIMSINHQSFTYFYNGYNWFLV